MTGTPWAFNTLPAHSLQAGRARDGQRLKMVHRVRQMGHRWNEVFFPMCITYSEKYKQLLLLTTIFSHCLIVSHLAMTRQLQLCFLEQSRSCVFRMEEAVSFVKPCWVKAL